MKAILLIFLVACSLVTQAKDLPLTGSHSVVFPTASPEGKNNAAHEAQRFAAIHAIEQMISTQPSAIRQLDNERKPHIVNDILAICTQVTNNQSLNEKKDEVTVTFSAVIDEDRMKDLLQRTQPVQANVQLESVDIAVFFTARNAAALQKQGQTVIQTNNLKKSKEASEAGAIADTAVQSDASVVERETKTTGASTVVTADQITYRLDPPAREEFGTALTARFAEKGFEEIIDGAMLDTSALLDEAYGGGNVIPAKTWRSIITSLRTDVPSVQYVVVGTLDMGTPRIDEATNMWVIEATVSGKIYKMTGKFPRLVAALSPQTQKAKAPDQLQAKKRVLSGLTPLAADEILAKLKAKNLIKSN